MGDKHEVDVVTTSKSILLDVAIKVWGCASAGFSIFLGLSIDVIDGPKDKIHSPAFRFLENIPGWPYVYGTLLVICGTLGIIGIVRECKHIVYFSFMSLAALYAFHVAGFIIAVRLYDAPQYPIAVYGDLVFAKIIYVILNKYRIY